MHTHLHPESSSAKYILGSKLEQMNSIGCAIIAFQAMEVSSATIIVPALVYTLHYLTHMPQLHGCTIDYTYILGSKLEQMNSIGCA